MSLCRLVGWSVCRLHITFGHQEEKGERARLWKGERISGNQWEKDEEENGGFDNLSELAENQLPPSF